VHARITNFTAQPDKFDETLAIIESQIIPATRARPGCRGISVMVDPETSSGVVISYWESAEHLVANDAERFWETQVAKALFQVASFPTRSTYHVLIQQ
jgi:quinol monooxygenase YgiN